MSEHKFPTEIIDLPSKGKIYPKDSPLAEGKIEIKYMTTKEEDILMSENLIKKGVVVDKLLDNLIVTEGVNQKDLILGDKNAVLIAARILAYGPEYTVEIPNPNDIETMVDHTFDLSQCPFKDLPNKIKFNHENSFDYTMAVGKNKIKFKLLTGKEESLITKDIEQSKKYGYNTEINEFVQNLLARDSRAFRNYVAEITPDIDLQQEVEIGGESVNVSIPLTAEFLWPQAI